MPGHSTPNADEIKLSFRTHMIDGLRSKLGTEVAVAGPTEGRALPALIFKAFGTTAPACTQTTPKLGVTISPDGLKLLEYGERILPDPLLPGERQRIDGIFADVVTEIATFFEPGDSVLLWVYTNDDGKAVVCFAHAFLISKEWSDRLELRAGMKP
jgi:hypothetical protein